MIKSKIKMFGAYTPDTYVSNEELCKTIDSTDEWIRSRTGIGSRFISKNENTSDLCANACRSILQKSNTDPLAIDLLIVATMTPDYLTPSTACLVQHKIGATNALAFDISAACSGFIYALSVADKFIQAGVYKNVLVVGGETTSKIVDWEDRGTCILFGDGAGGVLLGAADKGGILSEDLHSDGSMGHTLTAGSLVPSYGTAHMANHADFYVKMDGREIFAFASRKVPESIVTLLQKANLTCDDIRYIVPHQANHRITEAIAKKLKLGVDKFYMNIEKYGNTSAASIPIALSEMYENGLLLPNDKIVLSGFGGGLTWGSILIEI